MAVTGIITPVLQIPEKQQFFSRNWRLSQLNLDFTKADIVYIHFCTFLEHLSCVEANERIISLALYIRLEFVLVWSYKPT